MTDFITHNLVGYETWWRIGYVCWAAVACGFFLLILGRSDFSRDLGVMGFYGGLLGVLVSAYFATSWR